MQPFRGFVFVFYAALLGGLVLPAHALGADKHASAAMLDKSQSGAPVKADASTNNYILSANAAASQFVYRTLTGDFIATAELASRADKASFGWQAQAASNRPERARLVLSNRVPRLEAGDGAGGRAEAFAQSYKNANILRLERRGDQFIASVARFGQPFKQLTSQQLDLPKSLQVGLFLKAEGAAVRRVKFTNVRVVRPAWPDLTPPKDYLGSRLEILAVNTGQRNIIHTSKKAIAAPNWTPDGKRLIYNSDGHLYSYKLANGEITMLDTGFADRNNNNHVLNVDGTQLGLSHQDPKHDGDSIIYALRLSGRAKPKPLTVKGPSYLHGWSPDGEYIIYTALRHGHVNIYRTTTDGKGEETQLTDTASLDDGSEYSPDGKFIYFNSNRSGTMQVWRMRADGSRPTQLTHDNFNNWFPHVSPDGKTLVFLSYAAPVASDKHPYYRRVYLRSMPVAGGTAKVIAYLYGGQGTIDVPSWSPDGKHVAFVSRSAPLVGALQPVKP